MQTLFKVEKSINCPQCGDTLPLYFKHTKLAQCHSCKSNIFLEDESIELVGERAVLTPELSLITLNQPFTYEKKSYLPLGMIRYSYGKGFWEEWWIKDTKDNEFWLSVDEGDLVLQQKIKATYPKGFFKNLYIGKIIDNNWIITEIDSATCEGFSGTLPKKILKNSTYKYIHLTGDNAKLKTLEVSQNGVETYSGKWISPFDIEGISS
jgi:hypothetical protein